MITKTVLPYEFMARWKGGMFAGAQFRVITVVADDQTGEVYVEQEGDPMTLEQALDAGLTVQISQVLEDSLARITQARQVVDAKLVDTLAEQPL